MGQDKKESTYRDTGVYIMRNTMVIGGGGIAAKKKYEGAGGK